MRVMHQQERAEYGERQRQRHDQDAPEVHQENDMRQRDEDDLFDQRVTQGTDRGLNQLRSVVERNDMHTRWQARFNLPNLLLYAVDYVFRVLARPRHDHAADGFGAVFYKRSGSKGIADLDGGEVFHEDRRAVMRGDDNIADIVEGCDQA